MEGELYTDVKKACSKEERKEGDNECCSFPGLEKTHPHEAVSTHKPEKNPNLFRGKWVMGVVTCSFGNL